MQRILHAWLGQTKTFLGVTANIKVEQLNVYGQLTWAIKWKRTITQQTPLIQGCQWLHPVSEKNLKLKPRGETEKVECIGRKLNDDQIQCRCGKIMEK